MKEMCTIIPAGSCPRCGHSQFVVYEASANIYLTNRDGEIIDHKEMTNKATGICCNCGKEFDMIIGHEKFIPATPLRKLLYEYSPHIEKINKFNIKNPMRLEG